ncbi:YqaJ viral recombinase family protein [Asticcacaulis endophyticus]|uniref:YqaJ viral recombinase domain-containing protein n=1 Tax=Asticcacaulis endophyticus TaxID=1395890 RepID=A0A918PT46_9CAUL|nr:YqaJ viral recombinase family protein [Asticcacaulis endophyticus]GGZ21994.1 hypothetical protein GCM10011273_03500 [Asticcacaulis endophyticus]
MAITYHRDLIQGTDEWKDARCGLLTASEMKLILTPTLKLASNDKERNHLWELAAQRISRFVEVAYIGDNALRGWEDEIEARNLYSKHYAPVEEVGFITNDKWGFTLGYSPDGLVGDDGLIESKSRRQKFQIETIATQEVPAEHVLQLQAGLLVSERQWIDFISYSGGLPMCVMRVYPSDEIQTAIIEASEKFEERIAVRIAEYHQSIADMQVVIQTERRVEQEMYI